MKTILIIFILVLCFTCWLGDSGAPPAPLNTAIKDVTEASYGPVHEDSMIPNFLYDEKARNTPYITKIEDNGQGHQAEFPWGMK